MDTIDRLQEVSGVEGSIQVNRVMAGPVKANALATRRRVCNHDATGIILVKAPDTALSCVVIFGLTRRDLAVKHHRMMLSQQPI
jgi:hypothetical protein